MHIPDGLINATTAAGTGLFSVGAVAYSLRTVKEKLQDRQVPLVGLTAAFIFAVQMLNFPVAVGTSGHLLGGALAAILLGPWTATLVLAVVLIVQAIGFADGGITALGANIAWGTLASVGGYYLFRALTAVLPHSRGAFLAATAITSWTTVVVASVLVSVFIVVGGPLPTAAFGVMLAVHALIGIGEAFITTAVIAAVISSRPDLVANADRLPQVTAELQPA